MDEIVEANITKRPRRSQGGPNFFGLRGNKRRGEDREWRDGAHETDEDRVELRIPLFFRDLPRRRLLDVAVRARRELHDERGAIQQVQLIHRACVRGDGLLRGALERRVSWATPLIRNDAAAVALHHRQRARDEIAERVGEVGGGAGVAPVPGTVAVDLEADLAQTEKAQVT